MRPVAAKAVVFPAAGDSALDSKAPQQGGAQPAGGPHGLLQPGQQQCNAWGSGEPGRAHEGALVGGHFLPYQDGESCCLSLSACVDAGRFVTARLGPVGADGLLARPDSVKVTGEWRAGEDLEWLIRGVPLRTMAAKSPAGLVACRFKLWAHGRLSRRWVGRTLPVALPSPPHVLQVGELELIVAACRGSAAEAASKRSARVVEYATAVSAAGGKPPTPVTPRPVAAQALGLRGAAEWLGHEIVRVAAERQWGITAALLHEVRLLPQEQRRLALSKADGTRRTALRLCVEGQGEDHAPILQALEKGQITALLGTRRPYWWSLRIDKVCHRTLSFLGQVWVGMPRPRRVSPVSAAAAYRPWTAPAAAPDWDEVRWSEPEECRGDLLQGPADPAKAPCQLGCLRMGADTELVLRCVAPGEAATFGPGCMRNPLRVPLLAAQGRIAGALASGIFDPRACARLAAELEACGPRKAGALAVACGADPRALADDGLSPYTAALLGEDPCSLLVGLEASLRARILRNDALAWAEAGRGQLGAGHADMVAAPLVRGLAVPEDLARGLLEYCFRADLPLLATRVLGRVDGQGHLLAAVERAADPRWLRAAERILQQSPQGQPVWCSPETLTYAVSQLREGRAQFGLLLSAFLARIRASEDVYSRPSTLASSGGAECPICFEPLCWGTPVAFADEDGRAVCPHFLCSGCARGYAASASSAGAWLRCPECRRSAPKAAPLPRLGEDPLGWFDFLAGPEGAMPRSTLVRAVSAMLPIDADRLGSAVADGSLVGVAAPEGHEMTAAEFLSGGLYAWVWRHEEEHRRCSSLGPPPDLSDRAEWFRYWSLGGGGLSRGDVLRAVLRTLEVCSMETERVEELRRRVDRLWEAAALARRRQQGHSSTETLTCAEFAEAGGLGDALEESFGMDLAKGGGGQGLRSGAGAAGALPAEASSIFFAPSAGQQRGSRPGTGGLRRRRGQQLQQQQQQQQGPAQQPGGDVAAAPYSPQEVGVQAGLPGAATAHPQQRQAPSAAAGVLGLLLDLPAAGLPGSRGAGSAGSAGAGVQAPPPPPNLGGCPCGPEGRLEALAALEGLERDLANSPRYHIVSI